MTRRRKPKEEAESIASIEVFGGVFALLLVLYVIMNIFSNSRLEERISELTDNGEYKISWGEHGDGFVVITYPDSLFIIEDGAFVSAADICRVNSEFTHYAQNIYGDGKNQIIFAILHNSVGTMRSARDCLQSLYPNKRLSIGWMVIDDQTMKSIKIDDLPYYLQE